MACTSDSPKQKSFAKLDEAPKVLLSQLHSLFLMAGKDASSIPTSAGWKLSGSSVSAAFFL
jgi:hypothetical protein